ncbi:hypothetical protein F4806DRAFT_347369 [Annulohypoxylon nitens]|nr:hypothetical protein F4806DRAFT_347369 [Annulohypoxylon nitens]
MDIIYLLNLLSPPLLSLSSPIYHFSLSLNLMASSTIQSTSVPGQIPDSFTRNIPEMPRNEPFYPDFKARIPNLFLSEGASKVRMVEVLPPKYENGRQALTQAPKQAIQRARWISSLDELHAALQQKELPSASRLFVLYRMNSWSRIDITAEMFNLIFENNRITPHFLKIIMGFESKVSSGDEDFMSCYFQIHENPNKKRDLHHKYRPKDNPHHIWSDVCYNIRHFERHGRALDHPWSCRQTAIHQNYDMVTNQSNWVIVNPSLIFESNLEKGVVMRTRHPMSLHICNIAAGTTKWREYLDYLAGNLKRLNQEIAIYKSFGEFGVNFSSKQDIHTLRQRLHDARAILVNLLNTLSALRKHEEIVAKSCNLAMATHRDFQYELESICNELKNHKQSIRKMLSISQDTRAMYDDILKLHGQELLHVNSVKLANIAESSSNESKSLTVLADKTYQDSRMTRIATIVAMIYLPANLVMSFFSTVLIWFDGEDDSDGKQDGELNLVLRIHKEIWIAVLSTVLLAVCTISLSFWWNRRGKLADGDIEKRQN